MDRFIVYICFNCSPSSWYLKSNMDRFIVGTIFNSRDFSRFKIQYGQIYRYKSVVLADDDFNLKSNMDRFIATH